MEKLVKPVFRHLGRAVVAYVVLLIALMLTLLAWYYVNAVVENQASVRFRETVQATQEAVDRRTSDYVAALYGVRSLFYASEVVEPEEWLAYVSGIEPESNYSGLQALGYAERVAPASREEFLRQARERGLPRFRPNLDPGGERSVYFPVTYIGPSNDANDTLLNQDLHANPVHREALIRAVETGEPRATSMIYVLTDETAPGSPADLALRKGFAVYLPVYELGRPQETAAERRSALEGVVFGLFWLGGTESPQESVPEQQRSPDEPDVEPSGSGGLLQGIFEDSFDPGIDFEVYDGDVVERGTLMYDDDGIRRAGNDALNVLFTRQSSIDVAGRPWTLYYSTLPEFEARVDSALPEFVRVSGIGISVLLFAITWLLVRSRNRAEQASRSLEDANRQLEDANRELESFSYSVSHDLRAPLRTIDGFSRILLDDYRDTLDADGRDYLERVRLASQHMGHLIDDLLNLSRVTRSVLSRERVDLSSLASGVARDLRQADPGRDVEFVIEEGVTAWGDSRLLLLVLENLLGNAWKFTSKKPRATIEFGSTTGPVPGSASGAVTGRIFYVRDDGAGFNMDYASKLFGAFQRLHRARDFEGTGIGLATVQRIVHRHGGRVWAEGEVGKGATFYFTLGGSQPGPEEVRRQKAGLA